MAGHRRERRTDRRDARRDALWERRIRAARNDPRDAAEAQYARARAHINRVPAGSERDAYWRALEAALVQFNVRFTDTAPARQGPA